MNPEKNIIPEEEDIILTWNSTPALWIAHRESYCGCGTCKHVVGIGKTKQEAIIDLKEHEEEV